MSAFRPPTLVCLFRRASRWWVGAALPDWLVRWTWAALLVVSLARIGAADLPSTSNPYVVKAAYLLNFAKYVQWPEGTFATPATPIRVGVLGDNPFGSILVETVRNRTAQERMIEVRESRRVEDLLDCQILFLGSRDAGRLPEVLGAVGSRPVLTVGESEDFLARGGMISLLLARERVWFDVQLVRARQAGLQLSARMLESARSVQRPPPPPGASP